MASPGPDALVEALTEFTGIADKVLESFKATVIARPTPSPIYHYTSDVGLREMLYSGRIWLSDIFHLNDPSELYHGFSHAVRILKEKTEAGPPEAQLFAGIFKDTLESRLPKSLQFFSCSFSTNGDELGQWRAYADNGRGYALGFDGKVLETAFGAADAHNSAYHMSYDDAALTRVQETIVEGLLDFINVESLTRRWGDRVDRTMLPGYMRRLAVILAASAIEAALFFKHEAYANEAEYRFRQLFSAKDVLPSLKHRFRSSEMVKYQEFDWRSAGAGMLKKIVVGPAIDPGKGKMFVENCLAKFHSEPVEVVISGIPYRVHN